MPTKVQDHVFGTYISLRRGMVIIGAVLPVLVWAVGRLNDVELQDSISAYYWAPDGPDAPSRNWFVGGLFAVAACLYLYKGFNTRENVALNLAGLFLVGVAVFPMDEYTCTVNCSRFSVHGTSAVLMFLCLVYVVWFRSRDTLKKELLDEADAARYRKAYAVIGLVMLASPLTAFVMNSIIGKGTSYIFFIEAAGIWAFAAYWWTKSKEFKKSNATRRALKGEILPVEPGGKLPDAASALLPPEAVTTG
jgi:hypothetical protein